METVRDDAYSRRAEAHLKEKAHEVSAEHHRKRGVKLGVTAAALSAIVGTTVFVAAAKLVSSGRGELTRPTEPLGWTLLVVVVLLSVLSPVLSACHQYLKDEAETEKHLSGVRHYSNVIVLLDDFIRTLPNKDPEGASSELRDISMKMANPQQQLPTLTDRAMEKARTRVTADRV